MVKDGVPQRPHSDLISRLCAGGSSSTAVTDGQAHEGGASTALYTTPGAAATPCLLSGSVGVMWEVTMLACLFAVGAFRHFRNRLQERICGTVPSFSSPVYCQMIIPQQRKSVGCLSVQILTSSPCPGGGTPESTSTNGGPAMTELDLLASAAATFGRGGRSSASGPDGGAMGDDRGQGSTSKGAKRFLRFSSSSTAHSPLYQSPRSVRY